MFDLVVFVEAVKYALQVAWNITIRRAVCFWVVLIVFEDNVSYVAWNLHSRLAIYLRFARLMFKDCVAFDARILNSRWAICFLEYYSCFSTMLLVLYDSAVSLLSSSHLIVWVIADVLWSLLNMYCHI